MADIIPYASQILTSPRSLAFVQEDGSILSLTFLYVTDELDAGLIRKWLHHKRSAETKTAYAHDLDQFYKFLGEQREKYTLRDIEVDDVYLYAEHLIRERLKPSTRARRLAAIKSVLSYAVKAEPTIFPRNVGVLVQLPKPPDELAQRILPEQAIKHMMQEETNPRNHAILSVLYYCGLRAQELCHLQWRQLIRREGDHEFGGILNVHGKGNVTRTIPVKHLVWDELQNLRPDVCTENDFVFTSVSNRNHGKHLTTESIRLIVQNAAYRVGVKSKVSPHWMRHGHATYAQAHGASPVLVKETLGHKSLQTTTRYSHIINGDGSGRYL